MTTITSATTVAPTWGDNGKVDPAVKSMLDTMNDETGTVTAEEKAAAYQSFTKLGWNFKAKYNAATLDYMRSNSFTSGSFVKRGSELRAQIHQMSKSLPEDSAHGYSNRLKLQISHFKSMSNDDKLTYTMGYSDTPGDWLARVEAQLKMVERIEAARESGELSFEGRPTGKGSAALTALIELSDQFDKLDKVDRNATKAWVAKANALFDDRPAAVKIDLSEDAKALMAQNPTDRASTALTLLLNAKDHSDALKPEEQSAVGTGTAKGNSPFEEASSAVRIDLSDDAARLARELS